MLDTSTFLSDGTQIIATGEAQDIVRRVHDGDPSLGWEGDPSLHVVAAPYTNGREVIYRFEVWGYDQRGEPYCAVVSDTCGPELIRQLMAADNRRVDVVKEALAHNHKVEADAKAAVGERNEDVADRIHFALKKDNPELAPASRNL